MKDVVEKTLTELLELLGYKEKETLEILKKLLEEINAEALKEIAEGVQLDKVSDITSLKEASEHVENDVLLKIIETASARILVNYFADNKKNFNKRQREIFLTFLLTNKLQRELEK